MDGLGWLLDYVCRLLKTFPGMTPEYVWWQLPMSEGQCYFAWAVENDIWLSLGGTKRKGRGYIGQEIEELVRIAKERWKQNGQTHG